MKVIFANRADALTRRGGDTVQMLKTKEYLEKNHAVDVVICLEPHEIRLHNDCNIVHIFNIQTLEQCKSFVEESISSGKKVILSPIYWNLWHSLYISRFYKFQGINAFKWSPLFERLGRLVIPMLGAKYLSKNAIFDRQCILKAVDFILPNSDAELACLAVDSSCDYSELVKKAIPIPNAVDLQSNNETACGAIDVKEYVLVVGRIEPNKNQLGVLLSLRDRPDIPVVFLGRCSDDDVSRGYVEHVKKIAKERGNVYFLDEIPHEQVHIIYKNALVHVLASFRESPGLVSLEALYYGANIVVSDQRFCPVDYYQFNGKAAICDPYSISSIRDAILSSLSSEKNNFDRDAYFNWISYRHVAERTHAVYKKVLNLVD